MHLEMVKLEIIRAFVNILGTRPKLNDFLTSTTSNAHYPSQVAVAKMMTSTSLFEIISI